jgi:hypothetical protein
VSRQSRHRNDGETSGFSFNRILDRRRATWLLALSALILGYGAEIVGAALLVGSL